MAGTLSPDPENLQKQRAPMASWLQSPPSPFMLGSNDDQLERAQARAARAAAIRRMSIQAANAPPIFGDSEPNDCLGRHQILELFQNCIKLASENKINQKNTWELNLIDHLTEIIKVEDEKDAETNFQKASCTLEAGVKIYSLRVDSVHSEAYKVLGGMNRAGQDEDQDTLVEDANAESVPAVNSKKEANRKISPLSTLESSFEALNLKKIDVAFAVDPLYHQTTAQFDEGGAKGLLLNNLGVYGKCRVLFDSLEVPGKCVSCDDDQLNKSDRIDLSFAKECIEEMVLNMRMKDEISPTLRSIVERFDEENRRPSTFYSSAEKSEESEVYNDGIGSDGEPIENSGNQDCDQDHDDVPTMFDGGLRCADSSFANYENEPCSADDPDTGDIFDKVDGYLILSLGLTSKRNSWAGPDHWKYRKTKGSEVDPPENESQLTTKRKRNKKQAEAEINFTEALDKEMLDIFAPPKNRKSLLLPASRPHCNIKLPEDCHYHPEDLVKLFLLPKIKCLGRRGRKSSDESMQKFDDYGQLPSWDDESEHDGLFDEAVVHNDAEDSSNLVSQPRQVNKIEVQYDKTSKQVDVQVLKETLWDCMQESNRVSIQEQEDSISFKQLLASFPRDCRADVTTNDISPHLCFICLLHLANEHGLSIHGHTNLDDLTVHLSL